VVGYFADPMQADLLKGLKTSPNFRGAYNVIQEDGRAETSQAIKEHADLAAIIVTDHSLAAGAAEMTKYVRDELGGVIRLGSLGVPINWEELFEQGLLHGIVGWDHYALLLQAASAVQQNITNGTPLEGAVIDALFYAPDGGQTEVTFPYVDAVFEAFWK